MQVLGASVNLVDVLTHLCPHGLVCTTCECHALLSRAAPQKAVPSTHKPASTTATLQHCCSSSKPWPSNLLLLQQQDTSPGKGLYALFKDCTCDLHWRMSCDSCSGDSKWAPCILFADKPRKINLIYRLLLQQTQAICSPGNTCCSFITRKRLSKLYWLSFSPSTSQTVQKPFLSRFCSQ